MRFPRAVLWAALAVSHAVAFLPLYRTATQPLSLSSAADAETGQPSGDDGGTAASSQSQEEGFENDGPFAWLLPYMDAIGFKQGNSVQGGIPSNSDNSKKQGGGGGGLSEAEGASRRQQASEDLQNIGPEERERRDRNGDVMIAVSVAYATWAGLIADDGGLTGHLLRALLALPLFLAVGLKLSAQTGL